MFGNIFGRAPDSQTPAQSANPTPAPQPTPSNPAHMDPTSFNPAPAPAPQSGQSTQQPAQQPASATFTLADLVGGSNQQISSMTNEDFALQFINGIMNSPAQNEQEATPAGINATAMQQHYANVDLTHGVDMAGFLQALQQNPEQAAPAFQKLLQQQSLNTMTALVPLINQLVARVQEDAAKQAVTQTNYNMTSSSLITAFANRFPYAANPATMKLVEGFAETLVKNAPRGTSVDALVGQLDRIFRGMAIGQMSDQNSQQQLRPGIQSDMSGVFNP